MNREQLKAAGLTDEQVELVMAEHGKATGALTQQVNTLTQQVNTLTAERDNLSERVKNYDDEVEGLRKGAKDLPELQAKLDKLQQDQAAAATASEQAIAEIKKSYEVTLALKDAKARNATAVMGLLDQNKITVGEDGTVVGIKEQIEALKADENTSFLFQDEQAENKPSITFNGNSTSDNNGAAPVDPFDAVLKEYQ